MNGFRSVNSKIKRLCFCAMFAALTCVGTFLSVPIPIGYFNLGDTVVLTGAWCLGPLWGTIAGAVGSALADLLMGYTVYVPATALIKGAMALVGYGVYKLLSRFSKRAAISTLFRVLAAILAEALMILGYFLYECFALGYGAGAVASIPGNGIQAVCGVIGAVLLTSALQATGASKLFLSEKNNNITT